MRKSIVTAVVVTALALAATAGAAGPERTEVVIDIAGPSIFATCDDYDIVLTDLHIERQALTWYDGSEPTLERRHVSFSGTFTNSSSGTTGSYSGEFQRTEDFTTGAVTLTGLIRQVNVQGRPAFVATGIDVADANDDIVFQAGHSLDAWGQGLCSAMA